MKFNNLPNEIYIAIFKYIKTDFIKISSLSKKFNIVYKSIKVDVAYDTLTQIYPKINRRYIFIIYDIIYNKYSGILGSEDILQYCKTVYAKGHKCTSDNNYLKFIRRAINTTINTRLNHIINNGDYADIEFILELKSPYANKLIKYRQKNIDKILALSIKKQYSSLVKFILINYINKVNIDGIRDELYNIIKAPYGNVLTTNDIIDTLVEHGVNILTLKKELLQNLVTSQNINDIKTLITERNIDPLIITQVLLHAINLYKCSLEIIQVLLDSGITIPDKIFIQTIERKDPNLVKLFIYHGADFHADNEAALIHAIYYEKYEIVKLLIERGANINLNDHEALVAAIKTKNFDIVKCLIEANANIYAIKKKALQFSIENNANDIVELMLEHFVKIITNKKRRLGLALLTNNTVFIETLVEYESSIHLNNTEALAFAVKTNQVSAVEMLIKYKINPYLNDIIFLNAIENNNYEIMKLLIDRGASISINDLLISKVKIIESEIYKTHRMQIDEKIRFLL